MTARAFLRESFAPIRALWTAIHALPTAARLPWWTLADALAPEIEYRPWPPSVRLRDPKRREWKP